MSIVLTIENNEFISEIWARILSHMLLWLRESCLILHMAVWFVPFCFLFRSSITFSGKGGLKSSGF
jgi:hypothetical protein